MSEKIKKKSITQKKTNRKKNSNKNYDKEFNINKFKEKAFTQIHQMDNTDQNHFNINNEYDKNFLEYISNFFTSNILNFTNRIINESKTLPYDIRSHFPLHKILLSIFKKLLMNEIEIVFFSLYLDKVGWITDGYNLEDNLLIIALFTKICLNTDYQYIFDFISEKNNKIKEYFDTWINLKNRYNLLTTPTYIEVNERFKILNKPYNTLCKVNYVDLNYLVDQILQMSLPYSSVKDEKRGRTISELTMIGSCINPENNYIKKDYNNFDHIKESVHKSLNTKNEINDLNNIFETKTHNIKRSDSDLSMNNIYRENNIFNQVTYPFFLSREQSYNFAPNYEDNEFKNFAFFQNKNNIENNNFNEYQKIVPIDVNLEYNKNYIEDAFKEKNSFVLPVNDKIANNFFKLKNSKDNTNN